MGYTNEEERARVEKLMRERIGLRPGEPADPVLKPLQRFSHCAEISDDGIRLESFEDPSGRWFRVDDVLELLQTIDAATDERMTWAEFVTAYNLDEHETIACAAYLIVYRGLSR